MEDATGEAMFRDRYPEKRQLRKKARTETDSYGKMRRLLKNATETLE